MTRLDPMKNRLYFHHIPKTAGTSLREFLVERAGADNVAPMLRSGKLRDALRDYSRFPIVTGHLVPMPGDSLPTDRMNVTLVRHPVDRVLSSFYFERNVYTAARRGTERSSASFSDWVASLGDVERSRLNAHLAGFWPLGYAGVSPSDETTRIEAAKRALDGFDVVGLQSSMADSLALVALQMGWLLPDTMPYANRTNGRIALGDVPVSTLHRLEQMLSPDLEIYEYAIALFDATRHRALRLAAVARATGRVPLDARDGEAHDQTSAKPGIRATEPFDADGNLSRVRSGGSAWIESATVQGAVSESQFLQSGERAILTLRIAAAAEIDDLDIGFSIRDATGVLVFATNTRVLGETFTISPGQYAAVFRFQNELGVGHYRIAAALHRGIDRIDGIVDHVADICQFDVVDHLTGYFEGRVRLNVDMEISARGSDGRVDVHAVQERVHENFSFLARRNMELGEFSAEVRALSTVPAMPRAADAVATFALTNTGDAPWPAFGKRSVLVSYHWLDSNGSAIVFDGLRTSLPRDIMPGESIELPCFLRAPEVAGRMRLVFTLVQEDVAWFDDRNPASACEVEVEIR